MPKSSKKNSEKLPLRKPVAKKAGKAIGTPKGAKGYDRDKEKPLVRKEIIANVEKQRK